MMPGSTASDLAPGARVCGQYVVERFVRRGALASVFVARAPDGNYSVRVIHTRPGAPPATPERVAEFTRALEFVVASGHRAIPSLAGVGVEPAGLVVVTHHPGGMTLRDVIARGARLRPVDVARVVVEVAAALDALHGLQPPAGHGVVTPENIAVSERPVHVWVEECGLAYALHRAGLLGDAPPAPPAYRSPTELHDATDPRGDLFSLASVAFECLAGIAAFRGETPESIGTAIEKGPRPRVRATRPDLPEQVDDVLAQAWVIGPAVGYPSAGAFAADFARALGATAHRAVAPAVAAAMPAALAPRQEIGRSAPMTPPDDDVDRAFDAMQTGEVSPRDLPGAAPVSPPRPLRSGPLGGGAGPSTGASPTRPPASTPPPPPARAMRATLVGHAPLSIPAQAPSRPARVLEAGTLGAPPVAPTGSALAVPGTKPLGATQRVSVPRIRPSGTLATGEPAVTVRPQARTKNPPADDTWEDDVGARPGRVSVVGRPLSEPEAVPTPAQPPEAPTPDDPIPLGVGDMEHVSQDPSPPPLASTPGEAPEAPEASEEATPTESLAASPLPLEVSAPEVSEVNGTPTPDATTDSEPLAPALTPPRPMTPVDAEPVSSAEAIALSVEPLPPTVPFGEPTAASQGPDPVIPQPSLSLPRDPETPPWAPLPLPPVAATPFAPMPPLRFVAAGATTSPMPAPGIPTAVRVAKIVGPFVLLAAVVVTAGQIYTAQVARESAELRAATAVDGSRPLASRHPVPPPVATAPPGTPAPTAHPEVLHPSVPNAAVLAAVDASVLALRTDAATVAVAAVGAADHPTPAETPAETPSGPLPHRPHNRDANRIIDALEPLVFACLPHDHPQRHLRIVVDYVGATGAVDSVHISPPFGEPPMGPCIDAAVRSMPVPRFSDTTWETRYVYDTE